MGQLERAEKKDLAQDLSAAVEARRELGPAFEDPLVESFLARLDQHIDERVRAEVGSAERRHKPAEEGIEVAVIGASFALGIPLMAIGGGIAQVSGVIAVAAAILGVNLLYFVDRWIRFRMR